MDLYPGTPGTAVLPLNGCCLPGKENPGQARLEWSIEKIASANRRWMISEILSCTMQLIANANRLAPIVNV